MDNEAVVLNQHLNFTKMTVNTIEIPNIADSFYSKDDSIKSKILKISFAIFFKLAFHLTVVFFLLFSLVAKAQITNTTHPANSPYATIQAAIDDAITVDGDIITIAAGTYDEQLVIDDKNITLLGVGDATILQPSSATILTSLYTYPMGTFWPGTVMAAIILVKNTGAGIVTLKNLKVDGTNVTSLPMGSSRLTGILYGESSGVIDGVTVTEIHTSDYVARSYGIDLSAVSGTLTVEVKNCSISDWSRNGIQVMGASLTADIHDNILTGRGTAISASEVPNGILFIQNAGGNATGNTIYTMHHNLTSSRSAGILFYGTLASGIVAENNDIYDVDDGIILSAGANNVIVRNNNLHDNLEVGVHIEDGAINNTILNNFIAGNDLVGIRFDGSLDPTFPDDPPGAGNEAHKNSITGNPIAIANFDPGQTFNATCNWYGSTLPASIIALISGMVTYTPWVTSGMDNAPGTPGFQTTTITASAGINNTISDPGETSLDCGDNKTYTIIPASCYIISDVIVDGVSVGPLESYTFTNVTENHSIIANSYTILGLNDVNLGKYNMVTNGSVGNNGTGKKITVGQNSSINGIVKASDIVLAIPVTVSGGTFNSPSGVTLPAFQKNTASVGGPNFSVPNNANGIVISNNYNNLTIGKDASVIVKGTIYGRITIKEGASVTFTKPVVDINELITENGKYFYNYTVVNFKGATVRVKNRVFIGERNRINGTNTTFYMGDNNPDAEFFTVRGNDTKVTANVYIPHGTLAVEANNFPFIDYLIQLFQFLNIGSTTMTGTFIAENISSDNFVTWTNDCISPMGLSADPSDYIKIPVDDRRISVVSTKEESFHTRIYPNPSMHEFNVEVTSKSNEPILLSVMDLSGKVLVRDWVVSNGMSTKLGHILRSGIYFAEIIQGRNKQVVKLMKLN